jgi:hypothetical protein
MNEAMDEPARWLTCQSEQRQQAIEEAARCLLEDYRERWPDALFINLYRLAATLRAPITFVSDLSDGARLLPVKGGFRVLVNETLPAGKFRCSVAHELAHTLFYSRESEIPRQLQAPNKAEETFCFDVARRVLAPRWLIDACAIPGLGDAKTIFARLTDRTGPFRLSKPLAARVMLADYSLATGVGGTWVKESGAWKAKSGLSYTSGLGQRQRMLLKAMASFWLKNGREPPGFQVVESASVSPGSSFVLVVKR